VPELASRTILSRGTTVGTGTGTFPTSYWSPPVNTIIVETPPWKPGVRGASTMTGRVAPAPKIRTPAGTTNVRLIRYRPDGRKTRPWPVLSRALSKACWIASLSSARPSLPRPAATPSAGDKSRPGAWHLRPRS
jgi:hypothetical protein